MTLKRKLVLLFSVAVTFLVLIGNSITASAENKKKVTIECVKNDVALEGMAWSVYQIADIDENNCYHLTEEFADYKVEINNVSTSELMAVAETLEAYIYVDNIRPLVSGVADSGGNINFYAMEYGVYLLSGDPVVIGDKYYVPIPSILIIDEKLDMEDGIQYDYNVTAVPKMSVLAATNRVYKFDSTVKIDWVMDKEDMRPSEVEVILTKDGVEFKKATLNKANNWSYKWTNLSSKYQWNVIERKVPDGYTVTIAENSVNINPSDPEIHDLEFLITHSGGYVEPEPVTTVTTAPPAPLPQTGQLWWPVPVCSAAGMILFAVGWVMYSAKRKNNEK